MKSFFIFLSLLTPSCMLSMDYLIDAVLFGDTNYESPLVKAIQSEDIAAVRDLIKEEKNINGRIHYPGCVWSLLGIAAQVGNAQIVELLLDAGASPNTRFYTTPLIEAARNGNAQVVKLLLKRGARVNEKQDGDTALYMAIYHENVRKSSIVDLARYDATIHELLSGGADINTALNQAIRWLCPEKCSRLMQLGADPNKPDVFGEVPLEVLKNKQCDWAPSRKEKILSIVDTKSWYAKITSRFFACCRSKKEKTE